MQEDKTLEEAATASQRMKMNVNLKKSAVKRKSGMKKALNKAASPEKLKKMAMKKARDMVAKKLSKDKDKSDMTFSAREKLEKKLDKKSGAIKKLAKKLLPKIKKANKEKVSAHKSGDDEEG